MDRVILDADVSSLSLKGGLDAVAASWTIGSEEDGPLQLGRCFV
jgi:hypothetical protein